MLDLVVERRSDRMKKVLFAAMMVSTAASSQALVWGFSAPIIDGFQEVPPTGSGAYGSASFTLDDQTWILTGSMTTTGLPFRTATGAPNVTGAHIHAPGPVGTNGPVVFNLITNAIGGTPLDLPGGITLYAWSGVLGGNTAAILQNLINGDAYINVHSVAFPAGEIRGQIECHGVVPEPATIAALSIGALALIRRRKK
jgi:hypothetical protein